MLQPPANRVSSYRVVKNTLRSNSHNMTKKHVALISKSMFILLEASRTVDSQLSSPPSASHTLRSSESDLEVMVKVIKENRMCSEVAGQKLDKTTFYDSQSGARVDDELSIRQVTTAAATYRTRGMGH